jgi:hypothetical protein
MKVIKVATALTLFSLTGCTTGSKVKHTINYYSVGEYRSIMPQQTVYNPISNLHPIVAARPVYIVEEEPTVTDLSKEITRKIYKKMKAAYYTN